MVEPLTMSNGFPKLLHICLANLREFRFENGSKALKSTIRVSEGIKLAEAETEYVAVTEKTRQLRNDFKRY